MRNKLNRWNVMALIFLVMSAGIPMAIWCRPLWPLLRSILIVEAIAWAWIGLFGWLLWRGVLAEAEAEKKARYGP